MRVTGYVSTQPAKEMKRALDRLKHALFEGLDDSRMNSAEKNEHMRKAYGYATVIEEYLKQIKNIQL